MKNMAQRSCFSGLIIFVLLFTSAGQAGIRSESKYAGVPIFDRWDGCTLYSGIFVMYIAEKAKSALRPYANKPIQINATEVWQPMNPGDGLIKAFSYLGPAPKNPDWRKIDGLHLKTRVAFQDGEQPAILMELVNESRIRLEIHSQELAPTLLAKQTGDFKGWSPSDGPSYAVVTRQGFWSGSRWRTSVWSIGKEHALPEEFYLEPKQKRQIKITFTLPKGEYDFLFGYGGGTHESECVASNLTAFDVDTNHKGKMVLVTGR